MSDERRSTVSDKITAAATVATAIAAAKIASETSKARREVEGLNRTVRFAADRQERIQLAMASEQAESNFRNTVLATLPLFKNEEDRTQFLTEQFLPVLKGLVEEMVLFPIKWITLMEEKRNTIKTYLKSKSGQDLKKFLSVGKSLTAKREELKDRSKEIEEAQAILEFKIRHPIKSMGLLKIGGWGFLIYLMIAIPSFGLDHILAPGLPQMLFLISPVFGAIARFGLYLREINLLKSKVYSLTTTVDGTTITDEKRENGMQIGLQTNDWESHKLELVKHLIEENKFFVACDPRQFILECVESQIKDSVQELQSFLPPSVRLTPSHFAQFLFTEEDVQRFTKEQRDIANLLNAHLMTDYENETVVIGEPTQKTRKHRKNVKPLVAS